jgi:hypothetical protein
MEKLGEHESSLLAWAWAHRVALMARVREVSKGERMEGPFRYSLEGGGVAVIGAGDDTCGTGWVAEM